VTEKIFCCCGFFSLGEEGMKDNEDLGQFTVDDLRSFIDAALPKFEIMWQEGAKNEQRWLGNNYTDKERQTITNQGRQPYSFGLGRSKVNRVVGLQASQRTQFNILAKADPNDEIKAELAKIQTRGVEKRSDFAFLETEVMTSGVGVKHGVSKMKLSTKDIYRRVKVVYVDYLNFLWDTNATAYNLNDEDGGALWVCEVDTEYRKVVEQKYNYKSTLVKDLKEGSFSSFEGRSKLSHYVKESEKSHDYDIITLFNFYIKAPRIYYYVVFEDSAQLFGKSIVIEKYDKKHQAEERLQDLQIQYLMQGLPVEGSIETKNDLGYDKYVFTYDKKCEYEKTDLEMFPYDVYRAIHFGDNWCSFMDLLKDPQKLYDRVLMQIDYALGKDNKVSKQLNVTRLAPGETIDSALRKIEEGKTILTNSSEEVLRAIEMKGIDPQWFQILNILTMVFEDLAMGQQFQGKANANDSGKKVEALIAQGGLGTKPFFDNLRRWKIGVGKNILSWMKKYETVEDIIRVQGGALTPQMIELLQKDGVYEPSKLNDGTGFVTLNKGDLSYLKDADFELEVTEEALSDTEKEARLMNAIEQTKSDPRLQQSLVWQEYLLSLRPIPQDIKAKLLGELKQIQQSMSQQAQQAQDLEKRKVDIEAAKVVSSTPPGTFGNGGRQ